jgi:hypothetical protein
MKYSLFFAIIYFFCLTGCVSRNTLPIPNEENIHTEVVNLIEETPTVMITTTATITVTEQPLIENEPKERTLELLQGNSGCKLPCWWGITPGETQQSTMVNILRPFSIISTEKSSDWLIYFVRSPINSIYSDIGEVRMTIATQNKIVKEMEVYGFNEESYTISSILNEYGIPDDIYISTYKSDYGLPVGIVPFTLAIYYKEIGILAMFSARANVSESMIFACIDKSPSFYLWSPQDRDLSVGYVTEWEKEKIKYLNIEQSTDFDVERFYTTFHSNNSLVCINTPINLWPSQ